MDTELITIERTCDDTHPDRAPAHPDAVLGFQQGRKKVLGIFHCQHQKPEHAHGVPDGRLPVCRLVRGQGPGASAGRADAGCRVHRAADGGLRPGDRQAIPGGHPDAVRLARGRPGCALQSGQLGTRSQARCENRQDTGADGRGNPRPPRCDRHRHARRRYATAR